MNFRSSYGSQESLPPFISPTLRVDSESVAEPRALRESAALGSGPPPISGALYVYQDVAADGTKTLTMGNC